MAFRNVNNWAENVFFMNYRAWIIVLMVVAVSGCIQNSGNTGPETVDYTPPDGFESTLTYIGNASFYSEDRVVYRNELNDYILVSEMGPRSQFYGNKSIAELERISGATQEDTVFREEGAFRAENISTPSSAVITVGDRRYVQVNYTGDYRYSYNSTLKTGEDVTRAGRWFYNVTALFTTTGENAYAFELTRTVMERNFRGNITTKSVQDGLYQEFLESVREAELE